MQQTYKRKGELHMTNLRIGITEQGDAGLDFLWYQKCLTNQVQGAILITKNLNDTFIKKVLKLNNLNFPIIIHATCTGWGGSIIEPNVPDYKTQLKQLEKLITKGFPLEQCVLRIDPIFPTTSGIKRVSEVLEYAASLRLLPQMRIRISVLDEYRHVKDRLETLGFRPIYGDKLYAPKDMMSQLIEMLDFYDLQFECCAEPYLVNKNQFIHQGCISQRDLHIMGFPAKDMPINPQNRNGCQCLSCKTELLNNKHRCDHKCAYCYWKD